MNEEARVELKENSRSKGRIVIFSKRHSRNNVRQTQTQQANHKTTTIQNASQTQSKGLYSVRLRISYCSRECLCRPQHCALWWCRLTDLELVGRCSYRSLNIDHRPRT